MWFTSLVLGVVLQGTSAIVCTVTADSAPVSGAEVVVNGQTFRTDSRGQVRIPVTAGSVQLTVAKEGFVPVTTPVTVTEGQEQPVIVELERQPTLEEHVTVSATRTDARVEDQAMRVEVLGAEEIEEKQLMTPGDIVMMLNEMGGLRVQATSPSLGAASIRVQGMRGRYTRFLSDGLPLFGAEVGGLGLLQIPPTDLGQVEVIKGVASALYGAGALGGVIDLISRRPGADPTREALVNATTRGGTDAVLFASQPLGSAWSATLLAGGHWQHENDVDGDDWADLAGYSRGVVRPRLFWRDDSGRSLFATAGATWEQRTGGTLPGGVLLTTGLPFVESLDSSRFDGGLVIQTPLARRYVFTTRMSATRKQQDHVLGDVSEHSGQDTLFLEIALRGSATHQTWVAGAAFERSTLDSPQRPEFSYVFNVPGLFVQDDIAIQRWLTVSGSARVDAHSEFGTFVSPRLSMLVRGDRWNSRFSVGSGFFAPSALNDDTEAAGLSRLTIAGRLAVERGRSASLDFTRQAGPLTATATLFRYDVRNPVVLDRATYTLANLTEATITSGTEGVVTFRRAPYSVTGTYIYVWSREGIGAERSDVPLTPRHSAGLVAMWEREGRGRVGAEAYLTGRQRLEDNPYRAQSVSYVLFGGLIERNIGRVRLFINAENLGNVRQTHWESIIRPTQAVDGRWTVDAWAPLDGRVINGGVRVTF